MTRKRFGQHFLAPAWADRVVEAIGPRGSDRFIEVGPGPGVLTLRLAPRVAHVTAIEIDRDLAARLSPQLPANVELIAADFLQLDLDPLVAAGPVRVAGNLPYNISSPILFKLLGAGQSAFFDATVMLQREVADRLVARPGTKDYGVLTIFTAAQASIARLLTLPATAFRPAPKVSSALVRLTFKPSGVPAELRPVFDSMVRSIFSQRRKMLGNALRSFAESLGHSPSDVLTSAAIDPARRPETLDLADLVRIARTLSQTASREALGFDRKP